ncbi:PIN domain-containing protein [Actomonas aquatica]|uniref:Ribonuclease VapC n=1 Tax=Actomonas aquatica TaxID=2866162 RepID=A0ABZ1C5E7_9BACT|nr:PIN domain-containing protein [Opitutus sp. WL0086]WRQ86954.1 PIN domain-containing protein [Opitutus sp. WL0086]
MAELVLIDSSYFIRLAREYRQSFAALDQFSSRYDFAINGVVWVEVIRGRSDPFVRKHYEERFATLRFLNPTPSTWQRAARLAWDLDRHGAVIPATDITIAATALDYGAAVLTFDRHFNQVPGLTVFNDLP